MVVFPLLEMFSHLIRVIQLMLFLHVNYIPQFFQFYLKAHSQKSLLGNLVYILDSLFLFADTEIQMHVMYC